MVTAVKDCHTQGPLKTQTLQHLYKEDCISLFILDISLKVWLYAALGVAEPGLLKLNMRFLACHSRHVGQGSSRFSETKNHLVSLLKHKFMNPNSRILIQKVWAGPKDVYF